MSEETVRTGTHYSNCVQSDLMLVLQGRVGAHKLDVVGNAIYVLLQISSCMLLSKIMKSATPCTSASLLCTSVTWQQCRRGIYTGEKHDWKVQTHFELCSR